MKEYYYLIGKDQKGPFTIEQLTDKGLTNETLVWTEGMENWQKLKDVTELVQIIKPKSVPPPPPADFDEKISKTEVTGQLKVTTEKIPNKTLETIKPNKTTTTWLIAWTGFHLFALLMSYSGVEYFNHQGNPKTNKFWPFVEYRDCWYLDKSLCNISIFNDYDWSEFTFYTGGALLIYLLVRISNREEQKK